MATGSRPRARDALLFTVQCSPRQVARYRNVHKYRYTVVTSQFYMYSADSLVLRKTRVICTH